MNTLINDNEIQKMLKIALNIKVDAIMLLLMKFKNSPSVFENNSKESDSYFVYFNMKCK